MRTATAHAASTTAPKPDLAGFLLVHAGMRQEFGLLAEAARQPLDAERAALVEDQLALVLEVLHHHHTAEDDTLWPRLRARVPAAARDLDDLEADHARIDPLLQAAGDIARPLAERATVLDDLHALLNAHLDREEQVAVPLIAEHITVEEWEALAKRALRETGRKRIPTAFGWYASAGNEQQVMAALATVPWLPRAMFRLLWWPAYRRRARALYGANAPTSVSG